MKKFLSITLCIVMMLSLMFSLISCGKGKEIGTYKLDRIKAKKLLVDGVDYLDQLGESIEESIFDELEDIEIKLTSKRFTLILDGEKDEYPCEADGEKIEFSKANEKKLLKSLGEEFTGSLIEMTDDGIKWTVSWTQESQGVTISAEVILYFD